MARKEYIGIALDGDVLKVAHLKVEKSKLQLIRVDQITLADSIETKKSAAEETENEEAAAESVFGIDEEEGSAEEEIMEEEIDDLLEEDLFEAGMEEEAPDMGTGGEEEAQNNKTLLANLLAAIDTSRVDLGLNITGGQTIFQVSEEMDFREIKEKDIIEDVEARLESIYGAPKSSDNYAFEVRDDGSLLLASHEDEPPLLTLLDQARESYPGKVFVHDIIPDEVLLSGLVCENNLFAESEITGILQFGPTFCRMTFMNGSRIMYVAPIIPSGTRSKKFLDTVFSKILFQLDTGELPGLDRLIIANNTLGRKAVDYFKQNFPDVKVQDFSFDRQKIEIPEKFENNVGGFTTAIGTAWKASGQFTDSFSDLSFLPKHVIDRQKIFKLQWHGVVLLLLILFAPIVFNYFYQANADRIDTLGNDLRRTNNAISQVEPTVQLVNELDTNIASLREDMVLLDTLSYGTRKWGNALKLINDGARQVGSTWLTTFRAREDGLVIHGVSLYRDRIARFVQLFDKANLQQVKTDEIRERTVYNFTMSVTDIFDDQSKMSPPESDALKAIKKQAAN